jgi:hypothetical protein
MLTMFGTNLLLSYSAKGKGKGVPRLADVVQGVPVG